MEERNRIIEALDSGFGGSRKRASLKVPVPVTTFVSTMGGSCLVCLSAIPLLFEVSFED